MVIQPLISVAIEQNSEETSLTEASSGELTTMSSDVLGVSNETTTSEEEPVKEEQDEEILAEQAYDERDLSKEDEANASHPVMQAQIEQEKLTGEINLGSDPNEDSITTIQAVALQAKDADGGWFEVNVFEDGEDHILNDAPFKFETDDILDEQNYRLVLDYVIEESDDEQSIVRTLHKGQYLFEQDDTADTPAEPEKNNEEPQSTEESTEEEDPQRDITPRAVSDVVYNGQYYNKAYANVTIAGIKRREATISYLRHKYERPQYTQYAVWSTDPTRITRLCANLTNASKIPNNLWLQLKAEGTNVVTPWKNNHTGAASMPSAYFGGVMTNLKPNTTYYVWLFEIYEGGTFSAEFFHPQETSSVDSKGIHSPYVFTTDSAVALSITTPTFTQASAAATTIPMVGKAYTGDVFQTSGQGKVQVTSNDGTTVQDRVTNLGHTITEGGTYNSTTVSGLTAGTRYRGRVAIKDYGGTWRYSGWSDYFYTPNTANQPAAPTLNTPTASNNATANVSATYNAGDVAAHPTSTDIQISTNNSTWSTITADTTPAITNRVFNTGSKNVTFTLSKLNAKTRYYVRYRVRNASNVWSGYSTAREFTTGAMSLTITAPTFTQASATTTSIPMVGKAYTGDIYQTNSQGKVQVTSNDGTTLQDRITNLGHTQTQGGTYNSATISGLFAGTRYRGRVVIMDYGGTWRYSAWSDYFYTPNTVNQPATPTLNTPTAANNATAAVSATYNTGEVAAHASTAEVQISTNNSTWTTLSTSTTPATTTPSIATGSKTVSFSLSKLNSRTRYYVRYRARNSSNVWSDFSASREFTTNSVALALTAPTFTQGSATATSIPLVGKAYTGDIFQTTTQGIVQVTPNDGTTIQDKVTNLGHTNTTGGSYNSATVGSLAAGTRYRGRVAIKDYGGTLRYSGWSDYFYTPNTVNQPAISTLGAPTAAADATADVSATYNAGDTAAHPTSTDIQISTDNSTWSTITAETTPAITDRVFNTGTKGVTFKLSKLNAKTRYYLRYRVRNSSNVWSEFSTSREFTTLGVPLDISPPVFDQATATATGIQLKQGTYTGDISQNANDGIVYTESYKNEEANENDWTQRVSNLQHTITRNGTYSSTMINGLTPGTRYRGWVKFKNAEGTDVGPIGQPEGSDNYYFYTKNIVSNLSEPTLNSPVAENGATAEFSVDYQAAGDHPDQPAAHPSDVKIYLSTDGTTFSEINASPNSPSIEDFTIDPTAKKATVKIKTLNAGQTYHVKCSVVNQGGESEQTSARTFTTNQRQPGLYISDTPNFHFGVQAVSPSTTIARLSDHQGTNDIGIKLENIGINSNWSFAARLSPLQTPEGSNQQLTGAQISFNKQLEQTTDGDSWQPVTQDFEGLSDATTLLPSDNSTIQLWRSTSVAAGQGKFKTNIGFDSVNLLVPGNIAQKGAYYDGKIEWLMVNEP
ncbi:hypothetical protein RV07_GL003957 [Enterococcus malodoratus]|nr:hypothetical protein RV07_GL003957 [Enterococcus malodoratus]